MELRSKNLVGGTAPTPRPSRPKTQTGKTPKTGFSMLPAEMIEQILGNLESDELLGIRGVCKTWNSEACRIVGKRRDYEVSWGGGDDPDHVRDLNQILRTTQNPRLFSGCSIESWTRFKIAKPLFENYGHNLHAVDLDLGEDFPLRSHIRILNYIYKLVTEWGPNINWLLVSLSINNLKRLTPLTSNLQESYKSKISTGRTKMTRLKQLGIYGLIGPFFPDFTLDLIKSSPKLEAFVVAEVAPDQWRYLFFGQSLTSTRNILFLEKLSQAPEITRNLKQFSWSLTYQLQGKIFFDPISNENRRVMVEKLNQIQLGQLESLELDASSFTLSDNVNNQLNTLLFKNPKLEDLAFHAVSQDAPLTIIMGNQQLLQPITLNVQLNHLKRLTINSIKGKVLDLFTSLTFMPKLEELKVKKMDPNHYLFYLDHSYFFRARSSLKETPHLSLKKLVFEYPFERHEDFRAIFDSFPNLENLKTPLYFGTRFLFGPRDIIGDVSHIESQWKLYNILGVFSQNIKTLKKLQVISYSELHPVGNWIKTLKMVSKLKGLGELIIHCKHAQRKIYVKKLNNALEQRKKWAFPIYTVSKYY